ncbi:hypothetical protein PCK1_000168 [Pneumocystis canis]|nr:hypothetical protein PCK1_000168 [Pneumocystis canis]
MDNGKIRTQGTSDDILSLTLTNKNDNFSLSISKKVSRIIYEKKYLNNSINKNVYIKCIEYFGGNFVIPPIDLFQSLWIRKWTQDQFKKSSYHSFFPKHLQKIIIKKLNFASTNETYDTITGNLDIDLDHYINIYMVIMTFICSLKILVKLHQDLFQIIHGAKLHFFDITPIGNMMTRFSNVIFDFNSELETLIKTDTIKAYGDQKGFIRERGIIVENIVVQYLPEFSPIIRNVSFKIDPCSEIGIVKRAGAGKSAIAGRIIIDGINILTIGLHNLQSHAEIFNVLHHLHFIESDTVVNKYENLNINMFLNLDAQIAEDGKNLSQGQRQLICLSGSLLKSSHIIIMDECTASVDYYTDTKIQKIIEFSQSIIIDNIIDYDKIPYNTPITNKYKIMIH